ncbi:hypothetical protein BGW41_004283 [Actinomortierella wolfii]|nr:hypothetical protein BGW41_004283 [Actinomortierella wolfii]
MVTLENLRSLTQSLNISSLDQKPHIIGLELQISQYCQYCQRIANQKHTINVKKSQQVQHAARLRLGDGRLKQQDDKVLMPE